MSKPTKQQAAEAYWSSAAAERSLTCPVRTTLNVLGGKWKLLILSYLLDEPRRYGELRRLMPEITEKMLIQELRELETDGIVARTVHQTVPPRVDYSLTGAARAARVCRVAGLGHAVPGPARQLPATRNARRNRGRVRAGKRAVPVSGLVLRAWPHPGAHSTGPLAGMDRSIYRKVAAPGNRGNVWGIMAVIDCNHSPFYFFLHE